MTSHTCILLRNMLDNRLQIVWDASWMNLFFRKQEPASGMREEYATRWSTTTCNEVKKCIGKKSGEVENQACN